MEIQFATVFIIKLQIVKLNAIHTKITENADW